MGFKSSSLAYLVLLLTFSTTINGLDVTKLLSQYPEFKLLNKYLTETKLADEINGQKTATILALDDAALSSLSTKSTDTIKSILSAHVLLDFYDEKKLMEAEGSHTELATLLSVTNGKDKKGFVFVNLINEGEVAFSSAVQGSPVDVKLVKTVTTETDVVSLLQVSKPIVIPGIETVSSREGGSIAVSPSIANAPAPAPSSDASSNIKIGGLFAAVAAFASLFLSF